MYINPVFFGVIMTLFVIETMILGTIFYFGSKQK